MKEIMKYFIIVILIFNSFFSIGQNITIDSVCQNIVDQISKNDSLNDWIYSNQNNTIRWTMIDTIHLGGGCCGPDIRILDFEKIDTVLLTLRCENGWNKEMIDSFRRLNVEIIDVLSKELISYCDDIDWRIKINKESFTEYPYNTLTSYYKFSKKGKYNIVNVVRLPDTTINNVGIFVDLSFNYSWLMISQEGPREKLLDQMEFVSYEILQSEYLITGRFEYK